MKKYELYPLELQKRVERKIETWYERKDRGCATKREGERGSKERLESERHWQRDRYRFLY